MFKLAIVAAVVSGALASGGALAGEVIKFKSHHDNVAMKWDPSELGDEPGHIKATFEAKGIGIRYQGPSEPPLQSRRLGFG